MLHIRVFQVVLRLGIAAFAVVLLVYCGLRVYAVNLEHRSVTLLGEAAQIQIGASEDSILPLVTQYSGRKWVPPVPASVDDCVDKVACEDENEHRPDYQYGIALSPFNVLPSNVTEAQGGRIHRLLTYLMIRTPSEWRDPLSLRDTWTVVDISIRARRVVAVHGDLYVEGRHRWLGNSWRLSAELPELDMRSKSYRIEGTFLTFPGNGERELCTTLLLPLPTNSSSQHRPSTQAASRVSFLVAVCPISRHSHSNTSAFILTSAVVSKQMTVRTD